MEIVFDDLDTFLYTVHPSYHELIMHMSEVHKVKFGTIHYKFVSSEKMREVNEEFLKSSYDTDVICFDYLNDGLYSADIYICIPVIERNARKFHVSNKKELHRVMIHSVLHVIGYDDHHILEQSRMKRRENIYLQKLKQLNNGCEI